MTLTPDQTALDRRVTFQTVFNARDLGGLPTMDGGTVRRGVVFRADGVHRLSGDDLDVARGLGLRTVIDLRTMSEVDHGRFPEELGVRWHHLPILVEMWSERDLVATDGAALFLRDRYLDMLVEGRDSIAQAVALVADHGPTLFHCAAGKDRTGMMAAVLLGLVGVSHEDIEIDHVDTPTATPIDEMLANLVGELHALRNAPIDVSGIEATADELIEHVHALALAAQDTRRRLLKLEKTK